LTERTDYTNLVDEQPLVQAADAALAELARRRAEFERNVSALAAQDLAEQQAYEEALGKAMLEGAAVPAPPTRRLPERADVEPRHTFIREEQYLTEERRRAVGKAYPDVLREAQKQAVKLLKAALPTVEQLMADMGEVTPLVAAVQQCRDAANVDNPEGRREYFDDRLTIEEFIRLAITGGDPISEILDLTGHGMQEKPRSARTGMIYADVIQLMGAPA
jgi:hypothetical protein